MMLVDEAEERDGRRARAARGEGRVRGDPPDVGPHERPPPMTDTTGTSGHSTPAGSSADAHAPRRKRSLPDRCRAAEQSATSSCSASAARASRRLLAAVTSDVLPVPVGVLKRYRTPAFVGPGTLALRGVVLGGDGGDTEMAAGALDAGRASVSDRIGARWRRDAARGPRAVPARPVAPIGARRAGARLFVTLLRIGMLAEARRHGSRGRVNSSAAAA